MSQYSKHLGFNPPLISVNVISQHLNYHYQLHGELYPLEGEREQNFRLSCFDGCNYLVRISADDENPDSLDYQTKALQHLSSLDIAIDLPRVITTKQGNFYSIICNDKTDKSEHILRVLTYLDGEPLALASIDSLELAFECGSSLGEVTRALGNFSHSNEYDFMAWDMTNGLLDKDHLWGSAQNDLKHIESAHRARINNIVLPSLHKLRRQIVHNDAHQENWLRKTRDATSPSALIDFGDLINTHIACDLAILCLGFAEGSNSPEQSVASAIAGYHHSMPLNKSEVDIVYDLMIVRQIFTLLLFDYKIANKASDSPAVHTARPVIFRNLTKLERMNVEDIRDRVFDHCRL